LVSKKSLGIGLDEMFWSRHSVIVTETAMQLFLVTPLFFAFVFSSPLSRELTPSWVNICSGTYLFSKDKTTWSDAYGECELYGGHLLQIDGLAENFCLLKYAHAEAPADWYWHSANDIRAEGVWEQYDGQMILWTPWWYSDYPQGGTGENCGRVAFTTDGYAGQWATRSCTSSYHYVCERS